MNNEERTNYLLTQKKTPDVLNELILLNERRVFKQLHKFNLVNDPDAISFGYEALYNAIMTFDSTKNNKFSTYATVCIYNRLGSHIRTLNTQLVKNTSSYDVPVGDTGLSMLDMLESPLTADGRILDKCGVSDVHVALVLSFNDLTNPLHKDIVRLWVASDFKMTHVRIAEELGCSQTYVSQIIKKFKFMLKKKLEEN